VTGEKRFKVLFLCTGNRARSIIAEYLLRSADGRRFEVYSAGSRPHGEVHPLALRLLAEVYQIDASGARSKSWDEYRDEPFDFVITVCDNARDSCPYWRGQTIMAHWGVTDPADFEGPSEDQYAFFQEIGRVLARRIERFCALPLEKLDRLQREELTREIGMDSPVPTRTAP
jgi:arsenate reductase (thioredoxin)